MSSDGIMPHSFPHGGGVEAAAKAWNCDVADILDLSTGLHPYGESKWLGDWLESHANLISHYPDVHGEPARSALANEFGVAPEQVLITAGAQAVIEVIFQAMDWKSMSIVVPCYNEPIRCAKRAGCHVYAVEAGEDLPVSDVLWWTSPNNPFGNMKDFPKNRFGVLDESYMPCLQRRHMGVSKQVIRLGSLTKTFCIPGLRLGYVIAEVNMIEQLKAWLPPWPASTLALHVLPELLLEAEQRDASIVLARERLETLLQSYHWKIHVSQASFVLAKPPKESLDFSRQRILVRTFPEWPQLQGWVRFGLPYSQADWQRLEAVLCQSH